jgi:ABC-type Fe3+-hydroxamate transport system substrate-binding protein
MTLTDQLGNTLTLSGFPKRIISLVPSQTELLFDLGLDEEIVGITSYCVHPKESVSPIKTGIKEGSSLIGGTKELDLEKIRQLKPDLIIGNKEENEKSQIEQLQKEFPVWMSDIKLFGDATQMIELIGDLTGKKEQAQQIKAEIQKRFIQFSIYLPVDNKIKTVLYLVWRKPYMAAGPQTFISHLLKLCALKNVTPLSESRYPEISVEDIQRINPSHIFLSTEPYPFKDDHIAELQSICPGAKVVLVDGEMFSWYGSRLLYAPAYYQNLLAKL